MEPSVDKLIEMAREAEREKCIRLLKDYWNAVEYTEDLSLEDAVHYILYH